jgi:hypothetical protein
MSFDILRSIFREIDGEDLFPMKGGVPGFYNQGNNND